MIKNIIDTFKWLRMINMYACHIYITPQFLFVSDPKWQITGATFKFMEDGRRLLHIPEALGEKRRILLEKKSEII